MKELEAENKLIYKGNPLSNRGSPEAVQIPQAAYLPVRNTSF